MVSTRWRVALVGLVLVAMVGIGLGAPAAVADDTANETATVSYQNPDSVTIANELQSEDGEVQVFVTFENTDNPDGVDELQTHAAETQSDFEQFAQQTPGVTVENEFWITSAVVATVDTETVDLESLASVESVTELLPLFEVETAGSAVTQPPTQLPAGRSPDINTSSSHTTYGLDQIDAPEVWNNYNTKGEGVRVAVLDTGVEPGHQDLDLYTNDGSDPQYPGGWSEFDGYGNRVDSAPQDYGSHGTHVSGTVTGGDASGEYIGVAPNAELMHSAVLTSNCDTKCTGTVSQIIAGMEWAVQNDADIISMSLGGAGYLDSFIEPVQNARSAGIPVVAAVGNSGVDTSISPGNVYDALSVGASDSSENIASFSGGEDITTDDAWSGADSSLISGWPDQYTVPDIAAPGSRVKSSVPGDSYSSYSGTSMATPHVSGALALVQSATDTEYSPAELEEALYESASKPDGVNEPEDERDTRYGLGIINVPDAIAYLEGASPDISVTGASLGESTISEGDSVSISATLENTGNAEGDFTVALEVDGSVVDSQTVTVGAGNTQSISFDRTFDQPGDYAISVSDTTAGTLTVNAGPDIGVTSAQLNETTIFEGEGVAITATLENTGDTEGDFTADLEVDNNVVDSQTVTVGAGNTQSVSFDRTFDQPGDYAISVSDTTAGTLTVNTGPDIGVTSAQLNETTLLAGAAVTVNATLENTGDTEGDFTADLEVDSNVVDSRTVTVGAGNTQSISFDRTFDQAGDYDINVSDTTAGTLAVEKPAEFTLESVELDKETANVSEVVTVTATITNTGDINGTFTGTLALNGTELESEDVSIDAGATETLRFEQAFNEPDEYALAVNSETAPVLTIENPAANIDTEFDFTPSSPANGTQIQIEATINSTESNIAGIAGGSSDFAAMELRNSSGATTEVAWNQTLWDDPQGEITVVWNASVPENASGTLLSVAPQLHLTNQENVTIFGTVEISEEVSVVTHYSNDAGEIRTAELIEALGDWAKKRGYFAGMSDSEATNEFIKVLSAWR